MEPKQDGSKCTECKQKHEDCAGLGTCPKADISQHVCDMFGIRVKRPK
jgi:hypothetical protein